MTQILKEKYHGLYHEGNILLSATHTHSGPGGYLQYVLYIISTQGFIRQSFDAVVQGIVRVSFFPVSRSANHFLLKKLFRASIVLMSWHQLPKDPFTSTKEIFWEQASIAVQQLTSKIQKRRGEGEKQHFHKFLFML